ncbi:MAG: hypothetical protein M1827_006105 [Pycnora praestabilis]|nr:MAG: hypothetical protein M1827_006105 [Pycnora praestabilis]
METQRLRGSMSRSRRGRKLASPTTDARTLHSTPRSKAPPDGAPHVASSPPPPPLTEAIPSDTMRFTDLAQQNLLNPILLQTITEDLKFDHMMPVQSATLHELLHNRVDMLAQAKTGTGKTIAFLLPAIQKLMDKKAQGGGKYGISLLVISPTRELAMQIAKEANALLQRLPQYKVCFAIGGTNKDTEEKNIVRGCDILVATPGRLYDHLSNGRIKTLFNNLDTLVLDEADRLLDMGFMNALKDIVACLPDKKSTDRQGMLFSATIAPHVQKVAHLVLAENYRFISTIPTGEAQTHERVPQLLITVPAFADVVPAMISSIRLECRSAGAASFKAIIFAPTAALADWYGSILNALNARGGGMPPISVLHSRVSQSKRTNITNTFREAANGVLVATDVVARGMDFPNVTNVFQVGIPADKESYIHRLGRTARAGREGRSVFIVTSHESFFPTWTLKDINIQHLERSQCGSDIEGEVMAAAQRLSPTLGAKVYQAWLGYYKNHIKAMQWDTTRLVAEGNTFAMSKTGLACPEVPGIQKTTVGKMGLKGVKGLVVIPNLPSAKNTRANGGGRPAGGGGEGRPGGNGGRGGRRGSEGRGGRGG